MSLTTTHNAHTISLLSLFLLITLRPNPSHAADLSTLPPLSQSACGPLLPAQQIGTIWEYHDKNDHLIWAHRVIEVNPSTVNNQDKLITVQFWYRDQITTYEWLCHEQTVYRLFRGSSIGNIPHPPILLSVYMPPELPLGQDTTYGWHDVEGYTITIHDPYPVLNYQVSPNLVTIETAIGDVRAIEETWTEQDAPWLPVEHRAIYTIPGVGRTGRLGEAKTLSYFYRPDVGGFGSPEVTWPPLP